MRLLLVLIGIVIVLTSCVPFKPTTEVFTTVVANDTVVVPAPVPVYVPPPVQPYVPIVEEVKLPTVNLYLQSERYADISSYFPTRNVPRTWWIQRYN